jgi:hypothetical protein
VVSFGSDQDLNEQEYINWLQKQSAKYPQGFVLLVDNETPIGQLELTVKEYKGKQNRYVNLYYLIPEKRGIGISAVSTIMHLISLKEIRLNRPSSGFT